MIAKKKKDLKNVIQDIFFLMKKNRQKPRSQTLNQIDKNANGFRKFGLKNVQSTFKNRPMDYKEFYADLTEKLQMELPLKAFPIRELVQILRNKNALITLHTELTITIVFNSGDKSGIMCTIETERLKGMACSLSHLSFKNNSPLHKEITDYQLKKAKRVDKLNRMG